MNKVTGFYSSKEFDEIYNEIKRIVEKDKFLPLYLSTTRKDLDKTPDGTFYQDSLSRSKQARIYELLNNANRIYTDTEKGKGGYYADDGCQTFKSFTEPFIHHLSWFSCLIACWVLYKKDLQLVKIREGCFIICKEMTPELTEHFFLYTL